jgi:hypothetical protein
MDPRSHERKALHRDSPLLAGVGVKLQVSPEAAVSIADWPERDLLGRPAVPEERGGSTEMPSESTWAAEASCPPRTTLWLFGAMASIEEDFSDHEAPETQRWTAGIAEKRCRKASKGIVIRLGTS